VSRVRHLIVVVPGIGGSVLESPDGLSTWSLGAADLLCNVIDFENLALDREFVPTRPVDDLVVLGPWLLIPGYSGLTHHLRSQFGNGLRVVDHRDGRPVPRDVDVLRVAYDFRRSVVEAADVLGRAVTAAVGGSGRRVVVVAHSMGGLVARYWVGCREGWRHCRALITLGTPHRGAPRALDWLVNGAGVGPFRSPSATRVLREWPSVHELLPQYPAVLPEQGEAVEVDGVAPELVRTFGSPSAGADLLRRAKEAARVHHDIAEGWAALPEDARPALLPYFGRGHATLNRAIVRDGRLRVTKADPAWRPNVGWFGDGTVPALSAIPGELSKRPEQAQALPEKHGPMGSTAAVVEKLVTLQGDDLPVRGTDRPLMPWIGWDVDDLVVSEQETDIGAELHHGAAGPVEAAERPAALFLSGNGHRVPLPMRREPSGWRATLPPLPEGVYRLDIEVRNAWHGTPVWGTTPLAVLDPPPDAQP